MSYHPGPWHVGSEMLTPAGAISIETEDGGEIAWVNDDFDTRDGNADLIATAPDLLAALEALYKAVAELVVEDPTHYVVATKTTQAGLMAHTAINKAKGNNLS